MTVADASATKVFGSEVIQRIGRQLEELVGRHGDLADPDTAELAEWLDVQAKRNIVLTFGGGVNEIQRELIAIDRPGPAEGAAMTDEDHRSRRRDRRAAGSARRASARDPVNQPMINNWTEAIGDTNPVYTDPEFAATSVHKGLVAPPAMAQVWTMGGLNVPPRRRRPARPDDRRCSTRPGSPRSSRPTPSRPTTATCAPASRSTARTQLESVVGPKRTALGEGWFVTTREHLVRRGRAGRGDDVPGAEVPPARAGAAARRRCCGR